MKNRNIVLAMIVIGILSSFSKSVSSVESNSQNSEKTMLTTPQLVAASATESKIELSDLCLKTLTAFPGKFDAEGFKKACQKVTQLAECTSVQGVPIYHYEKRGNHKTNQKILVFSLIHGDETAAGSVGRFWMERLESIEPRNSWRVVPVLNPDGVKVQTRTNAHQVDINRNFPTKDWEAKAQSFWKKDSNGNPRRFPGNQAASEPETRCALKHIEDFKPDMIVSIHTPLKVLDFDGPSVNPPKFDYLPWKSLGHYPGSLGRLMWFERKVPVLTMELKEDLPVSDKPFVDLQDIIGFLVSLEFGKQVSTDEHKNTAIQKN